MKNTILNTANSIALYCKGKVNAPTLKNLCINTMECIKIWCSNLQPGSKHNQQIRTDFQPLFVSLNNLINFINQKEHKTKEEKNFIKSIMYIGTINRYVNCSKQELQFNEEYVSWMTPESTAHHYIKSKMGNVFIMLETETTETFGINIAGFNDFLFEEYDVDINIVQIHENEILYPTIKKDIKITQYDYRDNEEEEEDNK